MTRLQKNVYKYPILKEILLFRLKDQGGFSILESLIAIVLVGLGLLAYGVSSGVSVTTNSNSEKMSVGITLAQDKMENIKDIANSTGLSGADSLANPTYSGGIWSAGSAENLDSEGNTGGSGAHYQRTWTIDQASAAYLYDASVTVTWGTQSRDTVTLQTRISR